MTLIKRFKARQQRKAFLKRKFNDFDNLTNHNLIADMLKGNK